MKKIFLALIAFTFVGSVCFAQQPSAPVSKATQIPVETKTFTGTVNSTSINDTQRLNRPGIVVIDDKGQQMSFRVRPNTSITTKDGKMLTLSSITKGSKVTVGYTMGRMGICRAQSIKLEK